MNQPPPSHEISQKPAPAGTLGQDQQEEAPLPGRPALGGSYLLPAVLFLATCASTYLVSGPWYCLGLMTTLTAHELGHFYQAMRYGVPASLPYFLPMPFSLFGTFGAVIFMQPHTGDRKSLFDIGITGPIAGLVPAIVFSFIGLQLSRVDVNRADQPILQLGEPLLFKLLSYLVFGPLPAGQDVILHPLAYAGWVGIFITALNLIPIGQLDGGHVLYALLRQRAYVFSLLLLAGAVVGMVVLRYWSWMLMILLLALLGPGHPPTHNDEVPLGPGRTVLGWLSLAFVIVGFTPTPVLLGKP